MSSVTNSLTASTPFTPRSGTSPKDRVTQSIASEVSSGKISAADGTALTEAFDSISSSLKSERTGTGGTEAATRQTRHDPAGFKDKVDSLVDDQVVSGSLTSDQADELKSILSQVGSQGPSSSAAQTSQSSDTATQDLLSDFIKTLQDSQNASGARYGATGTSSASQAGTSALLVDFDA